MVRASPPPLHTAGLLAALVGLQLLSVLNPGVVEADPEEMYNAGHALSLASGHWPALWRLQYREFCGGCTVNALLGAPLFWALGARWWVWKLVPLAYSAVLLAVGHRVLHRVAGRTAGVAFAALLVLGPRAWQRLSLVAWGNHYEAGVLAALCLLLLLEPGARRAAAAGFLGALAVVVGFSGAFALPAGVLLLAIHGRAHRLPVFLLGALPGFAPWLGQYLSTGGHPFVTIYQAGEGLPLLERVPQKLLTLLEPRQLVALLGTPHAPWGWIAGGAAAAGTLAAAWAALRRRDANSLAALLFLGAWLLMYLGVRFQVYTPPAPEIAAPGSVRYAAPIYPLLAILAACIAGGSSRRWGTALVLLLIPGGLLARLETPGAPFPAPRAWSMDAVDHDYFRIQGSYCLRRDEHETCPSETPAHRRFHAYSLGRAAVIDALGPGRGASGPGNLAAIIVPVGPERGPFLEGLGEALIDHVDGAGGGALARLEQVGAHLDELPDLSDEDVQIALSRAALARAGAPAAWATTLGPHDEQTLLQATALLEGQAPRLERAVWWALGHQWGDDVTGTASPSRLWLPEVPLPASFVAGLGQAVGEAWGPERSVPAPQNLPVAAQEIFVQAYVRGAGRRWSGPVSAPALTP